MGLEKKKDDVGPVPKKQLVLALPNIIADPGVLAIADAWVWSGFS